MRSKPCARQLPDDDLENRIVADRHQRLRQHDRVGRSRVPLPPASMTARSRHCRDRSCSARGSPGRGTTRRSARGPPRASPAAEAGRARPASVVAPAAAWTSLVAGRTRSLVGDSRRVDAHDRPISSSRSPIEISWFEPMLKTSPAPPSSVGNREKPAAGVLDKGEVARRGQVAELDSRVAGRELRDDGRESPRAPTAAARRC